MPEMSVEEFRTALGRHVSGNGEVFPSALELIDAEWRPAGRLWEVARVVMADQEHMRYQAGGSRPEEVLEAVARWADSSLSLEQIRLIIEAGGYDPDPFEPIVRAGQLQRVLRDGNLTRIIHGERAGSWISDQLALADESEIVARVFDVINADRDTATEVL